MNWTELTIDVLKFLKDICGSFGSYGMAIILLTVIVRIALLPLSVSQQKSMKKMQELTPKLKQIQLRYKSEPQVLQKKMMEFYKENNFNPLGGCFPLLLQMPVFILLYTTLISVPFIQIAGHSSFLFIHRLDGTLQSYTGAINDGTFNVKQNDKFITDKYNVKIILTNGDVKGQIDDYRNAIKHEPQKIEPGKPILLTIPLNKISLPSPDVKKKDIKEAIIPVLNDNTKEIETLTFNFDSKKDLFTTTVKTAAGKTQFNYDVLFLIVLFGITMMASQKILTSTTSSAALDPQQKAMQDSMNKMMPIMMIAIFVIVPIPAGVFLYMVVSNIIQVGQTIAINKYLEYGKTQSNASKGSSDIESSDIIDVEAKEVEENEDDTDNKPVVISATGSQQGNKLKRKKKKGKKFK